MRQWWILRVSSKGDVLWQLRMLPSSLIRSSCLSHGFFLVTNHKVDGDLIQLAYDHVDHFLNLPIEEKIKDGPDSIVANYFEWHIIICTLVYQKYSEAMHGLALSIMELLAIRLGVDRMLYREFFEDAVSIMRTNLYPTCQEPNLSLGTGPHCDSNALPILHQDLVGGLDVFVDNKWHKVRPIPGALVINIGGVFAALSNGIYRSSLHRAVVNSHKERGGLWSSLYVPKS
ncbi:PREDICTED: gibberellin [Prunus dulcis]|uniref:PREDICTED: gibberellin n=1 Tax=Prunus dulcis TaxID=3755 RepID=A0A5E4FBM7_PRUDU|nr:PREDICTED: gibberellin [Prunus dulcis]